MALKLRPQESYPVSQHHSRARGSSHSGQINLHAVMLENPDRSHALIETLIAFKEITAINHTTDIAVFFPRPSVAIALSQHPVATGAHRLSHR